MRAYVVYDVNSPNTEAVARAIAEGIGPDARAVSATEASLDELRRADLLVVGASVRLDPPTPSPAAAEVQVQVRRPPVLLTAPLRRLLYDLRPAHATGMAFETRLWWSAHTVKFTIGAAMSAAGCRVVRHETFVVRHRGGRLAAGELARARVCGAGLAAWPSRGACSTRPTPASA